MVATEAAGQSRTRKITLLVLGFAVAGTVFLLPQFVKDPWVGGEASKLPPVPEASPSQVAPSTAAELTRWRQESQSVLAEIVATRDRLLEQDVEGWSGAEFQQALEQVETGDERYSYGDYAASLEQYRQARDKLADIEALGRQKLAEAKAAASEAIESLNLNVARSSTDLAVSIGLNDPEVIQLARRTEILDQVAEHIEAGDLAMSHDRFSEARSEYGKAVDLDPRHQRAARSLAQARGGATESAFRNHMSRGFEALERRDFDGARNAFRDAGKVRPGDPAVGKALAQVDNRESAGHVNSELERAARLEASESWAEAQAIYEALLAQDASLNEARVRLIPARVRADLDKRLAGFIAEPLSLSSKASHDEAQTALADARGIPDAGPRLGGQIAELDTLLARANSPVEVVFRSDNQTHVVLYRVTELGQFDKRSLNLRPGKYVAAGTREGFRDVRVEFTVTGVSGTQDVEVRCEEPIG